jgi:hypothetical protein
MQTRMTAAAGANQAAPAAARWRLRQRSLLPVVEGAIGISAHRLAGSAAAMPARSRRQPRRNAARGAGELP